jgi:hypothetical protein
MHMIGDGPQRALQRKHGPILKRGTGRLPGPSNVSTETVLKSPNIVDCPQIPSRRKHMNGNDRNDDEKGWNQGDEDSKSQTGDPGRTPGKAEGEDDPEETGEQEA